MTGVDVPPGHEAGTERRWDVALSFAGTQRDYVGRVSAALKARGVRCFYDADEQVRLWGKHLAEELPRIYAEQSAAVVVFVSAEYAGADWTRLERRAVFSRAVAEAGVFVLPARFDDTKLPGLLPDMVSVDLRRYTSEQFADLVAAKLADLAGRPPGVQQALGCRPAAGQPLAAAADPFALEVHRPVQLEDPPPGLSVLPTYVVREHDAELEQVVRSAAQGRSGIAVLVGGSSTGKTRACWEALRLLRDAPEPWRLWHPIDPTRPDAALRELPRIHAHTVVWLNEAQFYLGIQDGRLGEEVAVGLREVLRDPARAPVLVLATLWPEFWDDLTGRPVDGADLHAQARELLAGHDITVPAAFSVAQLQRLSKVRDARLTQAAAGASDGQVIQFLAGVPELIARYRNADPGAKAVIHAAMDARRLGMGIGLSHAFLAAAAPAYLTDAEWDSLSDDWLGKALAYTAVPCKGVRGPLTRIRSRPATGPGSSRSNGQSARGPDGMAVAPLYRLADYLDEHGRQIRKEQFPPVGFWAAVAEHAFPSDQAMLGDAADDRGLYRVAAQLYKNAAACGNLHAVLYLSNTPQFLRTDGRPMHWAAAHAPLETPDTVAGLLDKLRKADARDQVATLLNRDPATHVSLENLIGLARLLRGLREVGAQQQFSVLAERAAAHAPLTYPDGVADLLGTLRDAGAWAPVAILLNRDPAAHVSLDDLESVALLLDSLWRTSAQAQVSALAERAAAHAPLDRHPDGIAMLLENLRKAGTEEQVRTLLNRDPVTHVSLDDPDAMVRLLDLLRRAGAQEQATALAERAAAGTPIDSPTAVARLLDCLRRAGAQKQATALAERAAAHIVLDELEDIDGLLDSLRNAGAQEQVATLMHRDATAHVALNNPLRVPALLDSLREEGAQDQVAALVDRLPGAGMFDLFLVRTDSGDRFHFGREADGSPAAPWGWEDLD